jgi:hypothetical protein
VSESLKPAAPRDAPEQELEEEVDGLPVLVDEPHVVRVRDAGDALSQRTPGAVMPAVQAAAMAAGGFVAGAAVVGLVQRRRHRSRALGKGARAGRLGGRNRASTQRGSGRAAELVQIVGSRSFLVDVHLLAGSGDR